MNIEQSHRKTVFMELYGICSFIKENSGDFMEVTECSNGEGFDITLTSGSNGTQLFQLTWGEYKALKKLVKALNK